MAHRGISISIQGLHGGADGSTVALPQGGPGVFLHGVYMFSLCMCGFSLGTPQQFRNMTARLIGFSILPSGVNECVSVLPCDGLATCPRCTPPPVHRLLEIGTSSLATHHGRSGRK
ncbi:hypothetical protein CHARACLAT_031934 [Characodon lateralis]|uniref:Uncharacterized protein n=1 Tax=Characodon lateralis TaxID=208331 RepID=A0ABU7D2V8_9TELE|nr:hypothetical protein [Characodon lateralis]